MIDWSRHNRQSDWTKINACVVGLGVAGFAAADALIEVGAQVTVIDNGSGDIQKEHGTVLEILGAQIYRNTLTKKFGHKLVRSTMHCGV